MLLTLALSCALASPPTPRQAIAQVLATQAAAWNRGDIPTFMAGYWHSDSLVFIGKSGVTYGWQPTLDNYKKNYPGAAQMGKLDFSRLRITLLGADVAQVVGHFHLARPNAAAGDAQGQFLLIFRKLNSKWVIVADHSS
ncbi:nuclear transport factor 2 family protein [Hymenobacter ginsengisoli]|uniref:Nuclear transport factor 2 family protein n=1 Tax=Hymenobacter ginsengisoli TaxID=1051626 RepID=A0ABP8QQL3_9BACT|nr:MULTISPECIES: nuclear transport factor 2 family protein [unclassified Hymenobacter]MBO2033088.1 nuclear transport factor 2 family protein [Hymenobacter sp. BT559]